MRIIDWNFKAGALLIDTATLGPQEPDGITAIRFTTPDAGGGTVSIAPSYGVDDEHSYRIVSVSQEAGDFHGVTFATDPRALLKIQRDWLKAGQGLLVVRSHNASMQFQIGGKDREKAILTPNAVWYVNYLWPVGAAVITLSPQNVAPLPDHRRDQ